MDAPEVCDADDQIPLPGFRFHPTDEELVSFYLRRKVDNRPISLELIRQIDIYKHNPWDLPSPGVHETCHADASSNVGDKEWYFFCKRGRKYKNSIRPNRVTGSGFWKATGIDKPVYSNGGEGNDCIGLKKTLVYYRGSAGKGTKTDWMMHEFRLPAPTHGTQKLPNSKTIAEEAEIWTLCRIFKRNVNCRRYGSNWKQIPARNPMTDKNTKICSLVPEKSGESYINFSCESMIIQEEKKPVVLPSYPHEWNGNQLHGGRQFSSLAPSPVSSSISPPSFATNQLDINDFITYSSNWDELRSMVEML